MPEIETTRIDDAAVVQTEGMEWKPVIVDDVILPTDPKELLKKYDKVNALYRRYKKALEGLTVGGSEFHNDPEYCAAYLRQRQSDLFASVKRFKLRADHEKARADGLQAQLDTLRKDRSR